MTRLNLSCFPSPFIIKSNVDERVTTSSQQAEPANIPPATTQDRHPPSLPRKRLRFGDYKLNIAIPGTHNRKPRIEYLPLGGTISAEGTEHAYEAGKKSGKELLLETAGVHIPHNVHINIEDEPPFTMDSKDLTPRDLLALRKAVLQKLDTADSIILTHGSDTMSVTAFFLHLTIPREKVAGKKIIFAGSMKPANFHTPDGPANLSHALRLAATPGMSGVMAVMNASGEVFSPPYFEKKHTDSVAAFQRVNGDLAAYINRIPMLKKYVVEPRSGPTVPAMTFELGDDAEDLPYVPVIHSQASVNPEMIIDDIKDKIDKHHARAIVYAATGNGTIHKDIEKAISAIVAETGIPIIRATKVGNGEVTRNDAFKDDKEGTICAGKLMPDLAALLAQVAIAQARHLGTAGGAASNDALRTAFDSYQTSRPTTV